MNRIPTVLPLAAAAVVPGCKVRRGGADTIKGDRPAVDEGRSVIGGSQLMNTRHLRAHVAGDMPSISGRVMMRARGRLRALRFDAGSLRCHGLPELQRTVTATARIERPGS